MGDTGVPLVDLGYQRDAVAAEVEAGFARVLASTAFVLGPEVAAFEAEYARFCGSAACVGVANGTDALELAMRAKGIGPGDEVIVPANTFVATAEAVLRVGARIVLVDCGDDFLIDVAAAAAAVGPRTRAVVAVHLYGQLVDVTQLRKAVGPNISIVEDAAQSQGARLGQLRSGALGDIAATSFYPGKNLGAFGDAGAVTTDDEEAARTIRRLRNHGGEQKYEHRLVGTNSRLDSLQAVVLRAKLARLDEWNQHRRWAAGLYTTLLEEAENVALPVATDPLAHVWHLYVVRVPNRDRVLEELGRRGVGAAIHYPSPIHLLPAFEWIGLRRGAFPVAERAADEILSLPIFPGITETQVQFCAQALRDAICSTTDRVPAAARAE